MERIIDVDKFGEWALCRAEGGGEQLRQTAMRIGELAEMFWEMQQAVGKTEREEQTKNK